MKKDMDNIEVERTHGVDMGLYIPPCSESVLAMKIITLIRC